MACLAPLKTRLTPSQARASSSASIVDFVSCALNPAKPAHASPWRSGVAKGTPRSMGEAIRAGEGKLTRKAFPMTISAHYRMSGHHPNAPASRAQPAGRLEAALPGPWPSAVAERGRAPPCSQIGGPGPDTTQSSTSTCVSMIDVSLIPDYRSRLYIVFRLGEDTGQDRRGPGSRRCPGRPACRVRPTPEHAWLGRVGARRGAANAHGKWQKTVL